MTQLTFDPVVESYTVTGDALVHGRCRNTSVYVDVSNSVTVAGLQVYNRQG
jgi:hypothetical protein